MRRRMEPGWAMGSKRRRRRRGQGVCSMICDYLYMIDYWWDEGKDYIHLM